MNWKEIINTIKKLDNLRIENDKITKTKKRKQSK